MKFWDSSAIVPLVVEEPASKACRQLLRGDALQLVWTYTQLEILSALWREFRANRLDMEEVRNAEARLEKFSTRWNEVEPVLAVRDIAERLLKVHPLRAADAFQLAAALTAFGGRTKARAFVTLDDGLAAAAEKEGFNVVQPA